MELRNNGLNPRYWQRIAAVFELTQILYLSPYISPPRASLPYKSIPSSDIVTAIRNVGLLDRCHYHGPPGICSLTGTIFPELFLKTTVLRLLSSGCGSSRTYFVIMAENRTPYQASRWSTRREMPSTICYSTTSTISMSKLLSLALTSIAL